MYNYITKKEQLGELLSSLKNIEELAFDIETTGLDFLVNKILLIQIGIGDAIYILDVRKLEKKYIDYIISLIENKTLVGHNLKFDLKFIKHFTGILPKKVYDTMLAEILIHQGIGKQFYSLAEIVNNYLHIEMEKETRNTFVDFEGEFSEQQLMYSALDVANLIEVKNKQLEILTKQNQLKILDLENKVTVVVANMEYNGIGFDKNHWQELIETTTNSATEQRENIKEVILSKLLTEKKFNNLLEICDFFHFSEKRKGVRNLLACISDETSIRDYYRGFIKDSLNLDSPAQMLAILRDLYNIDITDTNEKTIKDFKNEHSIIKLLLDYRESEKKVSTYGTNFFSYIHPQTNRIHFSLDQLGTYTGRFSGRDPNMQNIPREENFRKTFIARDGYNIITSDYSQAELRLLAVVSGEEEMLNAFRNGIDLHALSACALYHIELPEVTKEKRQTGKNMNFGVVYGISEYGLYYNFGVPLKEGRVLLENYFNHYKTLKAFLDALGEYILKVGYSITPMGRIRFFEKKTLFQNNNEYLKYIGSTKREGINHVIQGGISDIVKIAMKNIFYENPFGDLLNIILQVHDEIAVEVHESITKEAKEFIEDKMIEAGKIFIKGIPVEVESHIGRSWSK